MIGHGYDWAWAQIPSSAVVDGGGSFVCRYLGGSARLTRAERDNHLAAGLGILLVFEQAATMAENPNNAEANARDAEREADALGLPDSCPIFFADDHNDAVDGEREYFARVVRAHRRATGVYGNLATVQAAYQAGVTYGWGVGTWGFGETGAHGPTVTNVAHLVQLANTREPAMPNIDPGQYDTNILYRPLPLWGLDEQRSEPTRKRRSPTMWCALLLDSNWCDVWYNGRIVDGFENSHDANEFNVSPTLQRYLDQGAGLTIYGAAGSATVDSYTAPNGVRASLLGK